VLGVLPTWGQPWPPPPHIHWLGPAGGRAWAGTAWGPCPHRFFLPGRGLRRLCRRTCLTALRQAAPQDHLRLPGPGPRWASPSPWHPGRTTRQRREGGLRPAPAGGHSRPDGCWPGPLAGRPAGPAAAPDDARGRRLPPAVSPAGPAAWLPAARGPPTVSPPWAAAGAGARPSPPSAVWPACHLGQLQGPEAGGPQPLALDASGPRPGGDTSRRPATARRRRLRSEAGAALPGAGRPGVAVTAPRHGTPPGMSRASRVLARHRVSCPSALRGSCSHHRLPPPPCAASTPHNPTGQCQTCSRTCSAVDVFLRAQPCRAEHVR